MFAAISDACRRLARHKSRTRQDVEEAMLIRLGCMRAIACLEYMHKRQCLYRLLGQRIQYGLAQHVAQAGGSWAIVGACMNRIRQYFECFSRQYRLGWSVELCRNDLHASDWLVTIPSLNTYYFNKPMFLYRRNAHKYTVIFFCENCILLRMVKFLFVYISFEGLGSYCVVLDAKKRLLRCASLLHE
jgi:hypothetical protein